MRRGTGILPVRSCGIGILPMLHGLEGAPNAEFCVGDPKPMPRESGSHLRTPNALSGTGDQPQGAERVFTFAGLCNSGPDPILFGTSFAP